MSIIDRFKGAWSAFRQNGEFSGGQDLGNQVYRGPLRYGKYWTTNSYTSPILNRIATDVMSIDLKHIKMDKDGFWEPVQSTLIDRLTFEANLDQTGRDLMQDVVFSMMDEGKVAIVPVSADFDPMTGEQNGGFEIYELRTGRILEMYATKVKLDVYDQRSGQHKQIYMDKDEVAIIENPLYPVMNGQNSTLNRLMDKIRKMDEYDTSIMNNKLNIIAQLPYPLQTEREFERAKKEINFLNDVMKQSPFGIGAMGSTTKITQINREVKNSLLDEISYLEKQFMNQLGLTDNVFNGTASESEMNQYYTRVIDPIILSIVDEINRKFISRTARTQGHKIMFYRDVFRTATLASQVEAAKTLSDSRIATANEMRPIFGLPPIKDDPEANRLSNPNVDVAADDAQVRGEAPIKEEPETQDTGS